MWMETVLQFLTINYIKSYFVQSEKKGKNFQVKVDLSMYT